MTLSRTVKRAAEKLEKRLAEVPKTSMNIVFTLAEVMRFGYAETLGGKCDLFDMHRAILYAIMETVHPFPSFPPFKFYSLVYVLTGFL